MFICRQRSHNLFDADHSLAADPELVFDGRELGFEHMVLLAEFDHPLLEDHVIESPLFAGTLGCFVVSPPPIPVAFILLVIRYKLALLALSKELLML